MRNPDLSRQNRICILIMAVMLALSAVVMSLPIYDFQAAVYTKKSGNTFVGDEKYVAVRAEVEAIAEEYRSKGFDVSISETVTERVNSKGNTTSLIAFTISQSYSRSLWSFLKQDFGSSIVLRIITACAVLSLVCAIAGLIATSDVLHRFLGLPARIFRSAAIFFALVALLLVPVFVMMNTAIFSRKVSLYSNDLIEDGKYILYARIDRFLFDGMAGESISDMLSKLDFSLSPLVWLLLPCFFAMLVSAIQIRFGTIRNALLKGILYAFVVILCVVTLYPYYVMFVTAFRTNAESLDMNFLHMFPSEWIWSNLKDIIHRNVPRFLFNSLLIAGGATAVAMICGIPAAYAMARMNFKGKKIFLGFVIMSQMFSPVVLLIGISQLMTTLHLNDKIIGLVLINAAFNQAFAVWLLRGTFVSISPEMEQAALIDGCGTLRALTKVLLPMAAPGIVTALIFVFINAWNEYTISTVLISTASNRPITVGITQFSSFNMIEWQYLFAASLLATIPVVILFMFIEKHLTSGLTSGGVKG